MKIQITTDYNKTFNVCSFNDTTIMKEFILNNFFVIDEITESCIYFFDVDGIIQKIKKDDYLVILDKNPVEYYILSKNDFLNMFFIKDNV